MKKITILIFLVVSIFYAATVSAAGGDGSPVAFWHFDENSGTVTHDLSRMNIGTLEHGAGWTDGKLGGGISFDGSDDVVVISSSQGSVIKDLPAFTFTAWIFPTKAGIIFRKSALLPAPFNVFMAANNSLGLRAGYTNQTGAWNGQNSILLNAWHQVAVAYTRNDGAIPALYVDGILQSLTQISAPSGTPVSDDTAAFIGNNHLGTGGFGGTIDHAKLYNYALSTQEVIALFKAESVPALGLWIAPHHVDSTSGKVFQGMLPEVKDLFTKEDQWPVSRSRVSVFKFYEHGMLAGLDDAFLRDTVIQKLRTWNMQMAVETGGGSRCQGLAGAADMVNRIRKLGGQVDYLVMDSPLWYPVANCPGYTSAKTIEDIVSYVSYMKGKFPEIKIGMTDPIPLRADAAAFNADLATLSAALKAKGVSLDFLQADNPYNYGTYGKVKTVGDFVRNDLRMDFGVIYNSESGNKSNGAFYADTIAAYTAYAKTGGPVDQAIIQSWYTYPNTSIPEDSVSDAPFTKLLLDFARLAGPIRSIAVLPPGTPPTSGGTTGGSSGGTITIEPPTTIQPYVPFPPRQLPDGTWVQPASNVSGSASALKTILTFTLRKGMRGDAVTELQIFLAKDKGIYPEGLITGYFGSLTESAVKRFQCARGIVCSGDPESTGYGTVGPKTRNLINIVEN